MKSVPAVKVTTYFDGSKVPSMVDECMSMGQAQELRDWILSESGFASRSPRVVFAGGLTYVAGPDGCVLQLDRDGNVAE